MGALGGPCPGGDDDEDEPVRPVAEAGGEQGLAAGLAPEACRVPRTDAARSVYDPYRAPSSTVSATSSPRASGWAAGSAAGSES